MATIEKKYDYKISRNGTYLGILPNVQSEFGYTQNINSAGAQLDITVADTADTSDLAVEGLEDEYGNPLQAEDGSQLTTERVADLVGDGNSKALIRNDNDVEVVEYSETYPNGTTVFRGYISKLKVTFGATDSVAITVLSNGQDLNHYLVPGGTGDTLDVSQTSSDGDPTGDIGSWYINSGGTSGAGQRFGQTWVVGAGITNISSIIVEIAQNTGLANGTITMSVWNSVSDANAGATPLGTVSKSIASSANVAEQTFTFATPITVTAGNSYFFAVDPDPTSSFGDVSKWMAFSAKTSSVYASGSMYRRNAVPANWSDQGYEWYFKTYYSAYSTAKTYTSTDPSTILTNLFSYYASSGGSIALSTPVATGYSPTYTFNLNTTLEGINKVLELGPANWYWYVNPATDTLYYKQTATTADHTMIKGRHISELSIEATKEQIANVVYFTGGEVTAGVNAYVNVNDTTSLALNRRGLVRLNDAKVKGASGNATGTIIANNYIDGHDEQTYITQVEIVDGKYDITTFDLGEIVGFGSFGTFVDRLLLQIVGIQRKVDSVVLSLGVLPHRATEQMEQVQKSLEATQTTNNPTAPS